MRCVLCGRLIVSSASILGLVIVIRTLVVASATKVHKCALDWAIVSSAAEIHGRALDWAVVASTAEVGGLGRGESGGSHF